MTNRLLHTSSSSMPWKCIDCKTKFLGPLDRAPLRGCPSCGGRNVFDCNVTPLEVPYEIKHLTLISIAAH